MKCPMDGMDGASNIPMGDGLYVRACPACVLLMGAS